MLLRIRHARCTIGEKLAELIARYNHESDVDASFAEGSVQMHHIHEQKVAPCRDLYFNANANASTVHDLALDPVQIARDLLGPAAEPIKLLVDELSNSRASLRILFPSKQELKPS